MTMRIQGNKFLFIVLYFSLHNMGDHVMSQISTLRPLEQVWYSGRRLTYTCMASVGSKEWYINRVYASHEKFRGEPYKALVSLSQDGRTSYLSVEASPATNNSEVICRLYNPPNADEMNRDVISVQGAVNISDVFRAYGTSSITIFWQPPFTLPGTELEYRITVSIPGHSRSIMTSDHNHTFLYSSLNISRCHTDHRVNFTVHGVNPAGDGEPAAMSVLIEQNTSLCGDAELIAGKLGPPTELTAHIEEDSVVLTWKPPFTFSDISHYLINATNSDNATHELGVVTLSNNPFYSLAITDLGIENRCTKSYEFVVSVGGVNFAGEGDFSNTTVTIPQNKRFCFTALTESVTRRVHMETSSTIVTAWSSDGTDMIQYISVAAGAAAMALILTVVATLMVIVCCVSMNRKRRIKTEPPNFSMDFNGSYGTTELKIKKNPAYEQWQTGPTYEVIAPGTVHVAVNATNPRASTQVYGQHMDA